MEEKLADYRAQKDREAYINKGKQKIKEIFSLPKRSKRQEVQEIFSSEDEQEKLINKSPNIEVNSETSDTEDDNITCCSVVDIVNYALWFIVWATMYVVFIKLQFGTVYLMVSALLFIYFNTRTKPKRPNEVSAYSVFNKNCESIDGTLKAEQFEKEIGLAATR